MSLFENAVFYMGVGGVLAGVLSLTLRRFILGAIEPMAKQTVIAQGVLLPTAVYLLQKKRNSRRKKSIAHGMSCWLFVRQLLR